MDEGKKVLPDIKEAFYEGNIEYREDFTGDEFLDWLYFALLRSLCHDLKVNSEGVWGGK